MMRLIKKNKGFTLISALVGMAILGVMALGVAGIADNVSNIIRRANAAADELMLIREVDMIISNPNHCKASLLLDNNVQIPAFQQSSHSQVEQLLNINLWRADVSGLQQIKRFSATDDTLKKYGSLTIGSMGLVFPESFNPNTVENVFAELTFVLERRGGLGDRVIRFPVSVNIATDGGGNGLIQGCQSELEEAVLEAQRESCLQANMYWDENSTPPCSDSMAEPTNSVDAGGGGGEPVIFPCPEGYVITGFRGRSGSEVDRVGFRCHRFSFETLKPYGGAYFTKMGGGGGGSPFAINCPVDKVATGFRGRSGARVDKLGLVCGNIDKTSLSFTPQRGGNGGSAFAVNCPMNTAIRGFYGRVGNRVDSLGAFCK